MSIVTVRVDEETKKKMNELGHVNWSGVLREAIQRKLEQEKDRDLAKAVILNEKVKRAAPAGWDSAKTIRYWRERRYGPGSNRR
jgi:hypothetical protein